MVNMKSICKKIVRSLKMGLIKKLNFLYWLVCKPFGVIAISSCTIQIFNKIFKYNLGDDLNFYLIKELTGKKIINYNNMGGHFWGITHYTCIGSIFDWCVDSSSIVWGTGDLFGGNKELVQPQKICAIRGPLTRKVLLEKGIACPEIYGDPVLLLPCVYRPKIEKKYKIGIIPHNADCVSNKIQALIKNSNINVHIIKMNNYKSWKNVVDEICSCECIASSSLHGIIISDAYNIPNVWIKLSNDVTGGGGTFKYFDYFLSVGKQEVSPIEFIDREIDIEQIIRKVKEYSPIKIEINKLIESCPFLNDMKKEELKSKIPYYFNSPFE